MHADVDLRLQIAAQFMASLVTTSGLTPGSAENYAGKALDAADLLLAEYKKRAVQKGLVKHRADIEELKQFSVVS